MVASDELMNVRGWLCAPRSRPPRMQQRPYLFDEQEHKTCHPSGNTAHRWQATEDRSFTLNANPFAPRHYRIRARPYTRYCRPKLFLAEANFQRANTHSQAIAHETKNRAMA